MSDIKTELKKAERELIKLRNKIKNNTLDYTVQLSVSSVDPGKLRYAAQLTAPAANLSPVTFIADSGQELIDKIKKTTKDMDYRAVEIAYHEAQVEACKRTISFHEDKVKELNGEEDEK